MSPLSYKLFFPLGPLNLSISRFLGLSVFRSLSLDRDLYRTIRAYELSQLTQLVAEISRKITVRITVRIAVFAPPLIFPFFFFLANAVCLLEGSLLRRPA